MTSQKSIRDKGKLKLSEYFKELTPGDKVALVKEPSITKIGFHKRMQGRTGIVEGKRGRSYVVRVKDLNMNKTVVVPAIHLKKIEMQK